MSISSFWKNYSKKQKTGFLLLCLFFFLVSHFVFVFRGSCQSSPCSELNQSLNYDAWLRDYYTEISTRPILAPTSLLIAPVLSAAGYKADSFITTAFGPLSYWPLLFPVVIQGIAFDKTGESFDQFDKQGYGIDPDDMTDVYVGRLISEGLILLSFPLWMFFSFLIIKGWKKHIVIRMTLSSILLLILCSTIFYLLMSYSFSGTEIANWNILYGIDIRRLFFTFLK